MTETVTYTPLEERTLSPEAEERLLFLRLDLDVQGHLTFLLGDNWRIGLKMMRDIYRPESRQIDTQLRKEFASKINYFVKKDNNLDDDVLALFMSYYYEYLVSIKRLDEKTARILCGRPSVLNDRNIENFLRKVFKKSKPDITQRS